MELYFTFELHKQQYSMDFHNNSREAKVYRITHTHQLYLYKRNSFHSKLYQETDIKAGVGFKVHAASAQTEWLTQWLEG